MQANQDQYPIFEANQVLSNRHLNDVRSYLDEQTRLTRANLIGIGIVCGLEIELRTNPIAIRLSKGLGVSSEGYLLIEPDDVELVAYRPYVLPEDIAYSPFADLTLLELFPDGETNTTPLTEPANFLDDKAVLLFLELKKAGLRNCSPNNCDDKGSAVSVTLRRLLITKADLEKLIADRNGLDNQLSAADLAELLASRMNLPDLKLPNYDVPNSQAMTTVAVMAAFQAVFKKSQLIKRTAAALSAAYQAFKPLFDKDYLSDPFAGFESQFGFLETLPTNVSHVRFLQYYYDLFDDLLAAYDEFRWQALDLVCLCCPDEDLFPRHLMLGLVSPQAGDQAGLYRHGFLPSPAVSACSEQVTAVVVLFRRLDSMLKSFSENPPTAGQSAVVSDRIVITPSLLGKAALSAKAIPYYYRQDNTPPLYQFWNPEFSRRGRAAQNLSYQSFQYASADFVLNPLRYDLEAYNFLRIEGHLGLPYQLVLEALLKLKTDYRLPIDIVALRSGVFDENVAVDLTKEACYFDDLNTLYQAYKKEISCALNRAKAGLWDKKLTAVVNTTDNAATAPVRVTAEVASATLGELYVQKYQNLDLCSMSDITQPQLMNAAIRTLGYFDNLDRQLADDVSGIEWPAMNALLKDMGQWVVDIGSQKDLPDNIGEINWALIAEVLATMVDLCKLEALKLIEEELKRRIREVRKLKFLSFFQQKHPGLRHKAGVTMGGTFILVYHERPQAGPVLIDAVIGTAPERKGVRNAITTLTSAQGDDLSSALEKITGDAELMRRPALRELVEAVAGSQAGVIKAGGKAGVNIFEQFAGQLADGAVIADFYLPYLCCSNCAPVQFVLPRIAPTFSVGVACTDQNNQAELTIVAEDGVPPYRLQLDGAAFVEFDQNPLPVSAGAHTLIIKDAQGTESDPLTVTIPETLGFGKQSLVCDDNNAYTARIQITGGTPPYTVNGTQLADDKFVSEPMASGHALTIAVIDSKQCSATTTVTRVCEQPCQLPCEGQSRRCAYRLWLQPPGPNTPYKILNVLKPIRFRFNGKDFEIPAEKVFGGLTAAELNERFDQAMASAIDRLNEAVNAILIENFGPEANPRLHLSYEVSELLPFRAMWIEHFVCETFRLEFDFEHAQPSQVVLVTVAYGNEALASGEPFGGMILTDHRRDNRQTRVPAFACSERNQCKGSEFEAQCRADAFKVAFRAQLSDGNVGSFSASVDGVSVDEIAAWVWDFPDAIPNLQVSSKPALEISFSEKVPNEAMLTAISKQGCFASLSQQIGSNVRPNVTRNITRNPRP